MAMNAAAADTARMRVNNSPLSSFLPSALRLFRLSSPGLTPPLTPRDILALSDLGQEAAIRRRRRRRRQQISAMSRPRCPSSGGGGEKSEQWKPTDDAEETTEKENPAEEEEL